MSRLSKTFCLAVAICGFAASLGGCSDMYYDRRETISSGAGDAVAGNVALQMIDPWPRASADRDFSSNGQRVEIGIARYRTGTVIPPVGTGTMSQSGYNQAPQQQTPTPPPTK